MMDQAKQLLKYRNQAKQIEKKLKKTIIQAESDDGQLVIEVDGKQNVKSVTIGDALMGDKAKLQKQFVEVMNKAIKKCQEVAAKEMQEIMGSLGLPGLG